MLHLFDLFTTAIFFAFMVKRSWNGPQKIFARFGLGFVMLGGLAYLNSPTDSQSSLWNILCTIGIGFWIVMMLVEWRHSSASSSKRSN